MSRPLQHTHHVHICACNVSIDFDCTTTPPSILAAAGIQTTLDCIPDRLGLTVEQAGDAMDKILKLVEPNFNQVRVLPGVTPFATACDRTSTLHTS